MEYVAVVFLTALTVVILGHLGLAMNEAAAGAAVLRVLGRVRLSRDTDASTSVARQREHIEDWARLNNAEVIGWAEDVDVSGKVDPFQTPDLGPWLKPPKLNQWDVMVAWKLDRVSRAGARTVSRLIDWLDEHGKYLVTTHDGVNTREQNITTEIMLAITSTFAKEEREAISARQVDSQRRLRTEGRFRGGPIPVGYRKVKRGDAWYLEIDDDRAALVRELVDLYLSGLSLGAVAKVMNQRGVPTPQGPRKTSNGNPKWRSGTLIQLFKSRTLLGETVYKGRVVRDSEGKPVMRAEPIITEDVFDRVQERPKNARKQPVGSWSGKKKLLLDVLFCALCGRKMYYTTGGNKGARTGYWRCSGATHAVPGETKCPGRNIRADWIEGLVLDYVTSIIGDMPITEEMFMPAEGCGAELKDVEETIKGLRWEWDNGLVDKNDPDEVAEYRTRLSTLIQRRDMYRSMPNKPARYEVVETGGTWKEEMEAAGTPEAKRSVLLKMGMKVTAEVGDDGPKGDIWINLPGLRKTVPGALSEPVLLPFQGDHGGPVVLTESGYVPI